MKQNEALHALQNTNDVVSVDVQPLHWVQNAKAVSLEPLSTNDWELVEIYAGQIEAGLFLNQVSVVYPNQILSLQLGSDVVYLRVLDQSFSPSSSCCSSMTLKGGECGVDNCIRLVSESEVIISPKPRNAMMKGKKDLSEDADAYAASIPLRVLPCEADFSDNMKAFLHVFNAENSIITKLLPSPPLFTAYMNPDTMPRRLDGWEELHVKSEDDSSNTKFIFVSLYKGNPGSKFFQSITSTPRAVAKIVSNEEIPVDCVGKLDRWY